jgi:hypothetical protein
MSQDARPPIGPEVGERYLASVRRGLSLRDLEAQFDLDYFDLDQPILEGSEESEFTFPGRGEQGILAGGRKAIFYEITHIALAADGDILLLDILGAGRDAGTLSKASGKLSYEMVRIGAGRGFHRAALGRVLKAVPDLKRDGRFHALPLPKTPPWPARPADPGDELVQQQADWDAAECADADPAAIRQDPESYQLDYIWKDSKGLRLIFNKKSGDRCQALTVGGQGGQIASTIDAAFPSLAGQDGMFEVTAPAPPGWPLESASSLQIREISELLKSGDWFQGNGGYQTPME